MQVISALFLSRNNGLYTLFNTGLVFNDTKTSAQCQRQKLKLTSKYHSTILKTITFSYIKKIRHSSLSDLVFLNYLKNHATFYVHTTTDR